jgi:hypothetical protein
MLLVQELFEACLGLLVGILWWVFLAGELLLRREPRLQLFAPLAMKCLENYSRHSLGDGPRDLAFSADAPSQRQFERKVHDRGMLQRLRRAHRHAAFAQIGHAGMVLGFAVFQNHRQVHRVAEITPVLSQLRLLRDGDVHRHAFHRHRFAKNEICTRAERRRGLLYALDAREDH